MDVAARTTPSSRKDPTKTLGVLALVIEHPSYGYELIDRARLYGIARSTVYTALDALERAGHIEHHRRAGAPARPQKHYRATAQGIAYHRDWVATQIATSNNRAELMAQLLGPHADPAALAAILDRHEALVLREVARLRPLPKTAPLWRRIALLHEQMRLTNEADFIKRARQLVSEEAS